MCNKTKIVARQACRATRGVHYLEIACCWISLAHILCNKSVCSQSDILQRIRKQNTKTIALQACRATRGSHSCDFVGIRSLPLNKEHIVAVSLTLSTGQHNKQQRLPYRPVGQLAVVVRLHFGFRSQNCSCTKFYCSNFYMFCVKQKIKKQVCPTGLSSNSRFEFARILDSGRKSS